MVQSRVTGPKLSLKVSCLDRLGLGSTKGGRYYLIVARGHVHISRLLGYCRAADRVRGRCPLLWCDFPRNEGRDSCSKKAPRKRPSQPERPAAAPRPYGCIRPGPGERPRPCGAAREAAGGWLVSLLPTLLLRLMSSMRDARSSPYNRPDPSTPSLHRPLYAWLRSKRWSSRRRWLTSRLALPSSASASTRLPIEDVMSASDNGNPDLEARTSVSAVFVTANMTDTTEVCVRCDLKVKTKAKCTAMAHEIS